MCPLRPFSANNFAGFWFWEFCVSEETFTSGTILNVKCFYGPAVDHRSYSIELIHKKHHTLFQNLNSFIGSKANPWQPWQLKWIFPILKFSLLTPLSDSAKKKSTTLQFLLESLVEDSGISARQNFSYDNFLKILKPVQVFSFAHDILLSLLQPRGYNLLL